MSTMIRADHHCSRVLPTTLAAICNYCLRQAALVLFVLFVGVSPLPAADGVAQLVRVPLPLTGSQDLLVKQAVQQAIARFPKSEVRPTLVLQLAPVTELGRGSDFSRVHGLARWLAGPDLSGVRTVAYVPDSIRGHGIMIAAACEYVAVAPTADFGGGDVDEPPQQAISPTVKSGYSEIARAIPAAVMQGLLDPQVEVLQLDTDQGSQFCLASELDAVKEHRFVEKRTVVKPAGSQGILSGRKARELQIVQYVAPDREALATSLNVPLQDLQDNPLLASKPRPALVELTVPITTDVVGRLQRNIERTIADDQSNFICLLIDSPGGSLLDSLRLVEYLTDLDSSQIRTVAYVKGQARADAALIALACDQVAIQPRAILGGNGLPNLTEADLDAARGTLSRTFPQKKQRRWSLPLALIDPQCKVFRCQHKTTGEVEFFSRDELKEREDSNLWEVKDELTSKHSPLAFTGEEIQQLQLPLAQHVVSNFTEMARDFQIEAPFKVTTPGWAHNLIEALASPRTGVILLMIGGAALLIEFQVPGIGLAGLISAVAFGLYFWGQILGGTAGWLEVLLFLGGIFSILIEVFILPGVAVFGLGGGFMVLLSLILASQTFVIPHNDYQWEQLAATLSNLTTAGFASLVVGAIARKFLPHTRVYGQMVLEPPSPQETRALDQRERMVEFSSLLGARGVATTKLVPAGKARFGEQVVDVLTRGEALDRHQPLIVIEAVANRIVVRAATQEDEHS